MKARRGGLWVLAGVVLVLLAACGVFADEANMPASEETVAVQEGQDEPTASTEPPAAVSARYPDVTLLVVVPERVGSAAAGGDMAAAETEIIKVLMASGYRCVDQAQVASVRDWSIAEQVMSDPAGPQARNLAEQFGAQILIIGHGFGEAGADIENLKTARGRVEVRVLVPATGEIIFAEGVTESGADAAPTVAALKALAAAGRRLAPKILKVVGEATGGPTEVLVPAGEGVSGASLAAAAGRKVRVAFAPFEDKSGWTGGDWNLSAALPDLIAQELMKLDIVEVVDRANLSQTLGEQGLDISGLVDRSEEPRELGTILPADILVIGRISMFQSKSETVAGGVLRSPVLGGLHKEKGVVKILLKVVDVKTGKVLGISEATGEATEAVLAGGYAGILFGGAQFDKTAMGRATRKAVDQAVRMIASCLERAGVAVRTCPNCGALVPAEARFCTQCGKRMAPQEAAGCPKCGARLPAGAKFCPECGAKVK